MSLEWISRLWPFPHKPPVTVTLAALGAVSCACGAPAHPKTADPTTKSAISSAGFVDGPRKEPARAPSGGPGMDRPDPTQTDADKYHALLENARVRVLRYRDKPGAKTHLHHHPDFVLYALSAFCRRLTFANGSTKERCFLPGDAIWMKDQMHIGENTGTTGTDVVIVELKAP